MPSGSAWRRSGTSRSTCAATTSPASPYACWRTPDAEAVDASLGLLFLREVLVGLPTEHGLVLRHGRPAPPVGALVVDLDQDPVPLVPAHPRAGQGEGPAELRPVQHDLDVPGLDGGGRIAKDA